MVFIAIGGAEDKLHEKTVLKRVLLESGKTQPRICVITTATGFPDDARKTYLDAFQSLGVTECSVLHIDSRQGAEDPTVIQHLADADIIFFSGGDQLRLTSILGGTPFLQAVINRAQQGAVIAGTSAGAAVMSGLMIYGGEASRAMEKGHVALTSGFGFVNGVVFDTHMERGRITRLFNVVATNPATLGIGLHEDTGVIVRGDVMEVIGRSSVTIVDGKDLKNSNVTDIERGETIRAENYAVHSLKTGDRYDLKSRKILPPL
ncbi:MAG: cyanophycinase [Alphaproteobacteria bacterium]|nr:cyanophycinase [Alphaproteobacteria bacterium]